MITLSHEELIDLTDCKRAPEQIAWLKENHFLFEISAKKKPKVLRSYLLSRLGGVSSTNNEPELRLK